MKSVIIIGAGMGGLAVALRLRYLGFDVTIIEKQKRPGGRSNVLQEHGFRVDIGPTILVMKETFEETYRAIGQDLNQRVKFVPLDPNYRIYYHDGTHLDLYNSMAKLAAECERFEPGVTTRLFRFIGEGAKKYELGMDFVVRNYDRITDLANPTAAVRLVETGSYQKLYAQACHFFKTDKLRKAFTFHSMFLGLSPFDALAMYSLITYADLVEGMQYPMGGIYSIIEDMVALAGDMGVTLRTGTPVEEIIITNGKASGVRLAGGEVVAADIVVSNADLAYTYKQLVPGQVRKVYTDARLDRMAYACAQLIASSADYAECRRIMFGASKNYSFASRLLPQRALRHVVALYALLRVGDDRVDVSHQGFASSAAAIEAWERAYWQAFATGRSDHPVLRAYLDTALTCGIPAEVMAPYFRAMWEDLTITRFPTFADLYHYMEGSALVVGRAMTYILGVRPPHTIDETLPYADSLSVAMQLSNFWRDIGQDWHIGRVYIPQEDLARFGVTEADIAAARVRPGLIQLLEFEFARTEHYYQDARTGVNRLRTGRWGVMAGLEVYRAILNGIRRNHYDVFNHRASASPPEKIGLALKARWIIQEN